MAMFFYNPHPDPSHKKDKKDRNTGDAYGWHAEIDESQGKLVVTYQKTEEKYIVDGFENHTGCDFYKEGSDEEIDIINNEPGLWYSFDPDHGNFHIVPDGSVIINEKAKPFRELLREKLDCILKKVLEKETIKEENKRNRVQPGECKDRPHTHNHKYFCVNIGDNQYLMSFNRLWCYVKDDVNHICNNFGQAQFMCYPIKREKKANGKEDIVGEINLFDGKFELMYPNSAEDGIHYGKFTHLAYNAPYNINNTSEDIAKGFVEFIKWCEGNKARKKDEACEEK